MFRICTLSARFKTRLRPGIAGALARISLVLIRQDAWSSSGGLSRAMRARAPVIPVELPPLMNQGPRASSGNEWPPGFGQQSPVRLVRWVYSVDSSFEDHYHPLA